MIYDTIQNAGAYLGISKRLDQALAHMMTTDSSALAAGRYAVDGDAIYLMVQKPALRPFENTAWEAHRKYIDIQFAFAGGETIAYAPLETIDGWEAYQESTDGLCSHSCSRGVFLPMAQGTFAVFFPNDAHRPLIGEGHTRKAVIKVLAEETE